MKTMFTNTQKMWDQNIDRVLHRDINIFHSQKVKQKHGVSRQLLGQEQRKFIKTVPNLPCKKIFCSRSTGNGVSLPCPGSFAWLLLGPGCFSVSTVEVECCPIEAVEALSSGVGVPSLECSGKVLLLLPKAEAIISGVMAAENHRCRVSNDASS